MEDAKKDQSEGRGRERSDEGPRGDSSRRATAATATAGSAGRGRSPYKMKQSWEMRIEQQAEILDESSSGWGTGLRLQRFILRRCRCFSLFGTFLWDRLLLAPSAVPANFWLRNETLSLRGLLPVVVDNRDERCSGILRPVTGPYKVAPTSAGEQSGRKQRSRGISGAPQPPQWH